MARLLFFQNSQTGLKLLYFQENIKAMIKARFIVCTALLAGSLIIGASSVNAQRTQQKTNQERAALSKIAEAYVKLVLAVGQHDKDYVDSYYGPKSWAEMAQEEKASLSFIQREAAALIGQLRGMQLRQKSELVHLRRQYLLKQLQALSTRVRVLEGEHLTFDQESQGLFDAVAPVRPKEYFENVLGQLDMMLPRGDEPLAARYEKFQREFIIPTDKLDQVFKAAIEEARRRTKKHLTLPAQESFTVEYVKDKPWSGYNWYQGGSRSLIQINTDLPIYIDRAVDLAAHEGYPGHHVYNVLLEQHLLKEQGFVEFSIYPLFSPQSLIAEGSANFGIEVAFPGQERVAFERDVLFPLAGINPRRAEEYYKVQSLVAKLSYAVNEAARQYLNGQINADDAARWLMKYSLMTEDRARQRVKFIDKYRSYVINYNLGQDLVKSYIEKKGGDANHPQKRWEQFSDLLSSPRLPSGLN